MSQHITRLLELIQTYRLDQRDPQCRQIKQMAQSGLLTDRLAQAMLYRVSSLVVQQERRPNYLHRAPEFEELYPHGSPDIVTGHLVEAPDVPVGMFLTGSPHAIDAGTNGSGKTVNLRRRLIAVENWKRQRPDQPLSIIVADRKGGDFADLPGRFGSEWIHLDALSTLRVGLNAPLGVPANVWISHVATCFCARAGLRYASVSLVNMIRWLLAAMNLSPDAQLNWPDFCLLLDLAKRSPRGMFEAKGDYIRSLIQCLEGITATSGQLFATFNGLDLERDIVARGKSLVIAMPNLSPPWLRQFLLDLLISQVMLSRTQRGHRVDRTEVIFVADEADADVSLQAEQAFPDGMAPVRMAERLGRELGVGVWLAVGDLASVSPSVLNEAAYLNIFRLPNAESVFQASRTLMLPRGAEQILPALEPGECLVRLPGSWAHAMLAKSEFVEPNRSVVTHYDSHPFVPSMPLDQLPHIVEAFKHRSTQHTATTMRQAKQPANTVPELAETLLVIWARHQWLPVARLFDLMDPVPSDEARKNAVEQLMRFTLAEFEDVRIERHSQRLMMPTEKGWEALKLKPRKFKGGMKHAYFAAWIADKGRKQGFDVKTEWIAPGKTRRHPVDVAWYVDGRWRCFEVVDSCVDNLVGHLTACLIDCDVVSDVTIVAAQKTQLTKIKQVIGHEASLAPYAGRIRYETITPYMPEA